MSLFEIDVEFWIRVAAAAFAGLIIGLERQLAGKPLGLRTGILIGVGTVVFVYLGASITSGSGDPSRVLGQIATGVGFLGAGVLFQRKGVVSGLTTAAAVWMLAAVSATIALASISDGLLLALLAVVMLRSLQALERVTPALSSGSHRPPDKDEDGA
jgi:putative Mg2+ transporter-C (MgtC) family protein